MSGFGNINTPGHPQSSIPRPNSSTLKATAKAFNPESKVQNAPQGSTKALTEPGLHDNIIDGPSLPIPAGANVAIWNALCTGSFTIAITAERSSPHADPNHPLFMKGTTFNARYSAQWQNTVLPYIRKLIFNLASTTDLYFFSEMLQSPLLPGLHANITKLDLSGFHWFSGITDNRHANPYLTLASHLPLLSELAFTLHTASITASMWGEMQMVELEATDPVRAKARRVLSLRDVCAKYGLAALFKCSELKRIRIVYIKSDIVTANTPMVDPEKLIAAVRDWLTVEFAKRRQQQVLVTISKVA